MNARRYDFNFPVASQWVAAPAEQVSALAGIAHALCQKIQQPAPVGLEALLDRQTPDARHWAIAEQLAAEGKFSIVLGTQAQMSPFYVSLSALAGLIAELSKASVGVLTDGSNAAGAWLAGAVPHRAAGAQVCAKPGLDARAMLDSPRRAYVLVGVEAEYDCADPALAARALAQAFVVSLSSYVTETHKACADVLLPLASFAETAGTFVNCEGRWQSFTGMASACGGARPGWKLLRVLGNLLEQPGFEYISAQQITAEVQALCAQPALNMRIAAAVPAPIVATDGLQGVAELPPYAVDAVVRRATALQQTAAAQSAVLAINAMLAAQLGVLTGDQVLVTQGEAGVTLPVVVDDGVARNCVIMPTAIAAVSTLGPACGPLHLAKA